MTTAVQTEMIFCRACGKALHVSAASCPGCGAVQQVSTAGSDKRILPAFLLCFFLGFIGVHRFYVGKVGTGLVYFFTFGLFGIGWLYDFVMILIGSFQDKAGNKITLWT